MDDPPTRATSPERRGGGGASIDRYQLIDEIGAGGMGVVWKAYDPALARIIAIKRVFSRSATELEAQRLHREAQAIAQLSHPNVIAVFDVGLSDGELYMAMEHVEGLPLHRWLDSKRPGREATLELFLQAARGLAAAHDAGLVHRDFKPSNVLVGEDGRVRVLDFGLARRLDAEGFPETPKPDEAIDPWEHEITRPGAISGTPRYMAAEQFLLREIDGRTDQFAFAVALYEALTRRRPFDGETTLDIAKNVVAGKVRPIPEDLSLPPWLVAMILRALRPRASERFGSMHEVISELERDRQGLRRAALDGSSTSDLMAAFPPPEDAQIAPRVRWLRERLEYAVTLKQEGDYKGALSLCRVVVREADAVDYSPLVAAALYMLGNLEHRTGDPASARETLYRAAEIAARAGDDWQVANIWVFLVRVLGDGLRRYDEAEAISRVAEVALSRIGDNPSLRSRLLIARGQNLRDQGRVHEALRVYEVALALDEKTHGVDHPFVAIALTHVAETLLELEKTELALRRLENALGICRAKKKLGPTYANCLFVFGRALARTGDREGATLALEEAESVFARYPDRVADLLEVTTALERHRGG